MSGAWEPVLEQLVRERYGRLLSRARLLVGSTGDAEDLVQDALVATFGGRARFASPEAAEQYVRRAIVSRFVDRLRRADKERAAHDQAALLRADGSPEEFSTELERALALLSPRERACVVLRHVEGMSVLETAAQLGLSDGAVKRYTFDGLASLNATLGTTVPTTPEVLVRLVPGTEVDRGA